MITLGNVSYIKDMLSKPMKISNHNLTRNPDGTYGLCKCPECLANPTDTQLKQALAKMLPDKVFVNSPTSPLRWKAEL